MILGHHDRSRDLNFCKFSAINSTPSSVILLHPDKLKTVKFGKEWTKIKLFLINNNNNNCYELSFMLKYKTVENEIR